MSFARVALALAFSCCLPKFTCRRVTPIPLDLAPAEVELNSSAPPRLNGSAALRPIRHADSVAPGTSSNVPNESSVLNLTTPPQNSTHAKGPLPRRGRIIEASLLNVSSSPQQRDHEETWLSQLTKTDPSYEMIVAQVRQTESLENETARVDKANLSEMAERLHEFELPHQLPPLTFGQHTAIVVPILLSLCCCCCFAECHFRRKDRARREILLASSAANMNKTSKKGIRGFIQKGKEKRGVDQNENYKFGDITRGLFSSWRK